jgi:RHS repeat-associated protein
MIDNGTTQTLYYTCKDHLGSITALIDGSGNVAEEYSYDAWGRRRNPADWTFTNVSTPALLTRGFTGHEHLDAFGLINMNGRIYDPVLGRFAQPDKFIQEPNFTQSYNRYSYCVNNPLKFTDPSGNSSYGYMERMAALEAQTEMSNNACEMSSYAFAMAMNTLEMYMFLITPTACPSEDQGGGSVGTISMLGLPTSVIDAIKEKANETLKKADTKKH